MLSAAVFAVFIIATSAGGYRRVPFSLEETYKFVSSEIRARWMTDTVIEYRDITTEDVMSYDVVRNETSILLDSSVLHRFHYNSHRFSSDGKYVLIEYDRTKDMNQQWLSVSRYVVYAIDTRTFVDVDKKSYIQHAQWFPGRNSILYIKNNNIYRLDLKHRLATHRITEDGEPGLIYNGICDLLYKEEVMLRDYTTAISLDGTQVIFLAIDEREVGMMTIPIYGTPGKIEYQYPAENKFPYSKPGTPISKFMVWHVNFTDGTVKPVAQSGEGREIIYQMEWVSDTLVQLVFGNRVQNETVVELCNLDSSREVYPCRRVSEDKNRRGWANTNKIYFSKDADRYLVRNRIRVGRTGYYHLILVYKNGSRTDLTPGSFMVSDVRTWDENKRIVYFESPIPSEPSTEHVFAVRERGDRPYCMTCQLKTGGDSPCRAGRILFNSAFTHFIGICRGPSPKFTAVYRNVLPIRDPIKVLPADQRTREWLRQRLQPKIMNLKVPVTDSMEAEVRLILPPSIDSSRPKKYPLVINVYAGPNSINIEDIFKIDWSLYLTTNKSIIYGLIDGRGTTRKGTNMMYATYRTLGLFEVQDQITVTRYISNYFPFIDKNRIGIWGWSYGGYATTKILEADVGGVFKCGAAVAPVTDWIYYNAFYTERYMDLPSANPKGYRNSSTLYNVENLRNKEYLLIHGTADDNVHYQHAMHLARVLEEKNIPFVQEVILESVGGGTSQVADAIASQLDCNAHVCHITHNCLFKVQALGQYAHAGRRYLVRRLRVGPVLSSRYPYRRYYLSNGKRETGATSAEVYPDEMHGINSLQLRVYYAIDRFWDKCFGPCP